MQLELFKNIIDNFINKDKAQIGHLMGKIDVNIAYLYKQCMEFNEINGNFTNLLDMIGVTYGSQEVWLNKKQSHILPFPILFQLNTSTKFYQLALPRGQLEMTKMYSDHFLSVDTDEYKVILKNTDKVVITSKIKHQKQSYIIQSLTELDNSFSKTIAFYRHIFDIIDGSMDEDKVKEFTKIYQSNDHLLYLIILHCNEKEQNIILTELINNNKDISINNIFKFFAEVELANNKPDLSELTKEYMLSLFKIKENALRMNEKLDSTLDKIYLNKNLSVNLKNKVEESKKNKI